MRQLAHAPDQPAWTLEGSVVFVDISGFTKLSEKLARKGKEGAEQVTEAIESCFTELLAVAYANGGGLLKFGGDALLLFFSGEGHAARAGASAVGMRTTLRTVGKINLPRAKIQLRMSVGAHSGSFDFFLVGDSHRELIVAGPAWTHTVLMEHEAIAGQIRVSRDMAALLPEGCLGLAEGPGSLLIREPSGVEPVEDEARPDLAAATIAGCLSGVLRAHVAAGGGAPEHRQVVTAFLRFGGTDEMLVKHGSHETAAALHAMVTCVQMAADEQGVCFLGTDVDTDGGKMILTSGAPVNTGSDEERMLLTLRRIADADLPLPLGIGVNRGGVFAGDIGPWYRRTYTVMGDGVNLAARLMAQAGANEIYATAEVLEHSDTRFEVAELEPFAVKGKSKPVHAWSLGAATGSRSREAPLERFSLVGRDAEMAVLDAALEQTRAGEGRLVQVVGEPGIGKTRLLEEVRGRSEGLILLRATCEAYTASTPYMVWRELLRELLDLGYDDPDDVVLDRLYPTVVNADPELLPWLPLIGRPFGIEIPATQEVEMLGEEFLRARLHESVATLLDLILDEPALIEIEDVHHMDDASADLLGYIADHLDGRPWLFCVSRRPGAKGFTHDVTSDSVIVEPEALSAEGAMQLGGAVAELHPLPPHALTTVVERSGGNPQFLHDLVLAAAATGGAEGLPDSVESAAMARIDRLAPQDRALVRRASVLGISVPIKALGWVLDNDSPQPDAATWERLSEFFEQESDGYIRFRRALLRDAAYEGLPFRLRRSLHIAAVDHLEREPGGVEEETEALSLHSYLAGRFDKAWVYGRLAGDRARDLAVPSEAARFYRRALDAARKTEAGSVAEDDLADVTEALGEMLLRAGELDEATRIFAEARKMHDADPVGRTRLLLREAYVAERVGRPDLVVRRARKIATELEGIDSAEATELRAQAAVSLAAARHLQGRAEESVRISLDAIREADSVDDRKARADAYVVMDWALLDLGRYDEATHLEEALEYYESIGDFNAAASVHNSMGALAYFQGRWEEAVGFYDRFIETKERLGDPVHAASGMLNVAEVLSDQGRWDEAEERLRVVLRVARGAKEENLAAYATAYLGRVLSRASQGSDGEALLEEASASFTAQRADREVEQVRGWQAEHAMLEGKWSEALASADELVADGADGALVQRIRGVGLGRLGARAASQEALGLSLERAEEEGSSFERALTELAWADLFPDEGTDDRRRSAEALLEGLGVIRIAVPSS